jgi:uncharacterized protein (DUF2235 family)
MGASSDENIALFIDGTDNDGRNSAKSATNVWKLYLACTEPADNTRYVNGVGTGGHWFSNRAGALAGFGTGERVRDSYLFLASRYVPGDHIYLFGYSRGAYAARSLAGF